MHFSEVVYFSKLTYLKKHYLSLKLLLKKTNFILKTVGGMIPRVGVKIPREILPPRGQAAHGYLHTRGGGGGKLPREQDKPVRFCLTRRSRAPFLGGSRMI